MGYVVSLKDYMSIYDESELEFKFGNKAEMDIFMGYCLSNGIEVTVSKEPSTYIPSKIKSECEEVIVELAEGARLAITTSNYDGHDISPELDKFFKRIILEAIKNG